MSEPSRTSPPIAPATRPIAPIIVVRVVVPVAAMALAVMHLRGGEQSLPIWIWKLAIRLDLDGITAVRLVAAFYAAIALVIALGPRLARPASMLAALLMALSAVAEVSALVSMGADPSAYAMPVAAFAAAGVLAGAISRLSPRATAAPVRLAPGTVLGPLAALLLTLGAAARLPVADRPRAVPSSWASAQEQVLFRDLDRLVGRTLPESGLSRYQPLLTALTIEGRHLIVFYNPRCGDCQELFDLAFASGSHPEVVAVEVPPPAGVLVSEGDPPRQPECPDCVRTTLQPGPQYFVKLPVVMTVENGRIRCASHDSPERCIDR